MTASERFTRIVSLVATLTRAERDGDNAPTLAELARQHGVPEREITADLRTLTLLGDHADSEWLLSLSVWQQDDRVSISSAGPFRRPVRLSPEERLAIQVALALDPGGAALARRFAAARGADSGPLADAAAEGPEGGDLAATVRSAARERRELVLWYAGEGEREAREWRVEPHQVAEYRGRTYLVAWAPEVGGWRHFRLDRALGAEPTARRFDPRPDFVPMARPEDVFRPGQELELVTVRFSAAVAGWAAERYPDHQVEPDGRVLVRFRSSSPDWLARRVLEYGAEAEVVHPPHYRDAVRQVVA